jgi:hypothetical protein
LKNTNPPDGPSPKRRRLLEDNLGYQVVVEVPPVYVCGQICEKDVLVIDNDEETVRLLEEALSSCS